jgi:hypothetical protein
MASLLARLRQLGVAGAAANARAPLLERHREILVVQALARRVDAVDHQRQEPSKRVA